MYMNQLTIIGFTGQDAELHYTQNGTPVMTLSVATKESWKNGQGEWQSRTEWHRVVAFGKLAEYAKTLPKGSHVLVQGPLRSREYDREGVTHRMVELRADSIGKLDRAVRRDESDAGADDAYVVLWESGRRVGLPRKAERGFGSSIAVPLAGEQGCARRLIRTACALRSAS
jgi:single-strand DNA-binding protein